MWQFKNVKQRAIMEVSNRLKAGMEKLVVTLFSVTLAQFFEVVFSSYFCTVKTDNFVVVCTLIAVHMSLNCRSHVT